MPKKLILISLVIALLLSYHFARAGILINEIMYDFDDGSDDGREWVEILNSGDTVVDLSSFKFFEADTNHKLKLVQGSANLSPGSYAIIISDEAKFRNDWPNFCCTLFDSSFSLSNSGETIALKDEDLIVDQYAYLSSFGGAGDGNSLQKISGVWMSTKPTPGIENKITYIPPPAPEVPRETKTTASTARKDLATDLVVEDKTPAEVYVTEPKITAPEKINHPYFFVIILIVLLGLGGGAVYFTRRRKIERQTGDDFEIVNE